VIVEVKDATRIYHLGKTEVRALRGVSLSVQEGDSLAIMGPSGSGKSTLMHLIGCLDRPTDGEVLVQGQSVKQTRDKQLARLRGETIGFVFQTFNLIPRISALNNVMLPMTFVDHNTQAERTKRATELLERVGLSHRINHMPNELSGGERQRVSIARALANDPALLLADEPTGNLDTKTGAEVLELFEELHGEGHTVIMVTHDANVASHMGRTIHMLDGRIRNGGETHANA